MLSTTNRRREDRNLAGDRISMFHILDLLRRRGGRAAQSSSAQAKTPMPDSVATKRITERRQSSRRWGDPLEVFVKSAQSADEKKRAWIKNRSRGGIGL